MSRKLCDQLKSEKSSLPYGDRHREINKSEGDSTLKSSVNRHKPGHCGRKDKEDELVRYMSKLPGYLEKGGNNCEKVLNVGVIDWTRLEQWKESKKHVRGGRSSTSSNTSSSVSTERLSGNSSTSHSNPPDQRMFHLSLQSHFIASPMQGRSHAIETPRRSVGNCQNLRGSQSNMNTQSKYVRADDHVSQNHPNSRQKGCNRKYLDPYIDKGRGVFPNDQIHEEASCAKLEISTQDDGLVKRVETLTEPNTDNVVQGTPRKSDPFSHRLPKDSPQNSHCRVPHMPQKSKTYSRLSFSEKPKELFHEYRSHDIQHSRPLPDELSYNHHQCKGSGCCSTDLESTKPGSTSSSSLSTSSSPLSVKVGISPSKSRKSEEKKQTIANSSSSNKLLHGLDQQVASEKPRSSSPFRRLSISTVYTSKESDCKGVGHVSCLSSIAALKSSTETSSENVRGYASSKISGNNKPGDEGRSRSSPLRRLLDPLLKPKTAKSSLSLESSQKDSVLTKKNCRSANGKFSNAQPEKEVDRVGCSQVNTIDSSTDKKHIPSMTQALLRIAVRNSHPLFTFAVDHTDSKILAATVKDLAASGKDECSSIYTFFTFREIKKKNGSWMNQTVRSKGPDCIPHAIAQMKVSDSHHYDLTSQNSVDSSTMKEFVLFSVKLGQGDIEGVDYHPIDELAAIAIKIPKPIRFVDDRLQGSCHSDSHDLINATVVLPGGVHSLPIKGGPSSLLERWKSGGSCDCGGWDLDCKLKILASGKPRSSKDQLDLFVQCNGQELRPAISLRPFKHGMYSIAFDPSLTLLQAFSISIALLDSKMPHKLSGSRNSIEGKNPRETLLVQTDDLNAFGKLDDIPASFVSYPPVSPVGRV